MRLNVVRNRCTRYLVTAVAEVCLVATTLIAVPAMAPAGPGDQRTYRAPLSPRPTVVRGFDNPAQRWLAGHRGVDLASTVGSPVLAAGAGVVRFAGTVGGKPTVSIGHPDGMITTYEPVEATVSEGAAVRGGEIIGTLLAGHPECAVAACLHWGARRGAGRTAAYVNPLALLGAVRVRLKPVDPDAAAAAPASLTPGDGPDGERCAGVRR